MNFTRPVVSRVLLLSLLLGFTTALALSQATTQQPVIGSRVTKVLQIDGLLFKDLNKNGRLDVYEDWRRPIEDRAGDLVAQMTVEEKAGLMVGPTLPMGPGGSVSEQAGYGSNGDSVKCCGN